MIDTTPLLITSETKVGAMLNRYPELIDTFVSFLDRYRNLTNPILHKTVAPCTPFKFVVQMGGVDLALLVNTLRQVVRQPPSDLSKWSLYAFVYLGRNLKKGDPIVIRSG